VPVGAGAAGKPRFTSTRPNQDRGLIAILKTSGDG
jgi:hypothetical protein